MKSPCLFVGLAALALVAVDAVAVDAQSSAQSHAVSGFGTFPIYFIENRCVFPDKVGYYVRGADKTLFFTREGVTIAFRARVRRWTVKLDFVGIEPDVLPRGEDRQEAVFSYFTGKEEDWRTGLPTFSRIVYEDLWPGIDLVYRGTVNRMKYEFVVKPGADPDRIRLRYRGADRVHTTPEGTLRVETPLGAFEDARPVAWQEKDGERVAVELAYDLEASPVKDGVSYGFRLGDFDATQTLVLDPAILVYCGYVGGNDYDDNYAVAVDTNGYAYITGETESTTPTFPAAVGPDLTYNGNSDAFVARIDPTGKKLVYCGYIGGTGYDNGDGLAADAQGNAYLAGYTESNETTDGFPVKVGPDLTFNGNSDGFVAKIDPTGKTLIYCGYIGGAQDEYTADIAIDASGGAYVAGNTDSNETTDGFPVKVGPDLTFNGVDDAFVAKVNPAGSALVYCGYIGGSMSDSGWEGIAVDPGGNAVVVGLTTSNETTDGFPVKVGPDLTYNGADDFFVAKVNPAGSALVYCGYIGGLQNEDGCAVAVDSAGCAYVAGTTESNETTDGFPVKVGPDLTFNSPSGWYDAFVAKVNAAGTGFVYCGYIGGINDEWAWGIGVDSQNNAYVSGGTDSDEQTFPVKVGPDLTYNTFGDAFIARVNSTGNGLDYCGYIGGRDYDESWSLAVDAAGNAYVGGDTDSDETTDRFPATVGPDLTYNLNTDDFIAKVSFVHITAGGSPRPGNTVTLQLTATGDAGLAYQVGSSLGTGPTPIGQRQIALSLDPVLLLSVGGMVPQIFSGYSGFLSNLGQGQARLNIPGNPNLIGFRIYSAFLTLDPAAPMGVRSISSSEPFTIMK